MKFETYPFEKLNNLLLNIKPNEKLQPIVLTIGEPQFDTPSFIIDELKNSAYLLNKYPKTAGEDYLKKSQRDFVKRRFGVNLNEDELLPTFGTREVLFNFPQFLLSQKSNPTMAYVNPFYQIYEGAAKASGANVIHLDLTKENDFKPEIDDERLKKCDLVIINSPSNPTASCMSLDELCLWAKKALEFDFVLLNDECYSELYINTPPPSLLQASKTIGNDEFKNILVVNSISKRSCAPGLRSGFIAGDKEILKEYLTYRTYVGCATPLPFQRAAYKAWEDDNHVEKIRDIYKENFKIAKEILGVEIPEGTFYIWLHVGNGEEFAKTLYEKQNVKVLPGEYLGRSGLGKEYIRIALVHKLEITQEALQRIKEILN